MLNNSCHLGNYSISSYVDYAGFLCSGNFTAKIFFCAVLLVFFLSALSIAAETFLCPSLTDIVEHMGISQNIAGVTFLAFGNGAPDIFAAIAAVARDKHTVPNTSLMLGALLGAGVFVTTVVTGSLCWPAPFHVMERPFLRDVMFYLGSTLYMYYLLFVGKIRLVDSAAFLGIYVVYGVVVVVGRWYRKRQLAKQGMEDANEAEAPTMLQALAANRSSGGASYLTDEDFDIDLAGTRCSHRVQQYIHLIWEGVKPFGGHRWWLKPVRSRIGDVLSAPLMITFRLTVPMVQRAQDGALAWNKYLVLLQCVLCPILLMFAEHFQAYVCLVVSLSGLVIFGMVAMWTDATSSPKFYKLTCYFGFMFSVTWIYIVANEIVGLLEAVGAVLSVSSALMGFTVLAWANSIGDAISNYSMAKEGYPRIGISACFASPMFNMLVGVGLSTFIVHLKHQAHVLEVTFGPVEQLLIFFLITSLSFSMIYVPLRNFIADRIYFLVLCVIYMVCIMCVVLTATGVFGPMFNFDT